MSVDTVDQNRAMVEKLILLFSLLSDVDGEVIRRYGVDALNETAAMDRPSSDHPRAS